MACRVLTYMTFWMRRHSRNMGRELREKVSGAVSGGSGIALGLVAFVTVGREAVETVIFLLAIAYTSSPLQLVIGAVIGLAIALGVSYAHVPGRAPPQSRALLRRSSGSLLMVVAAGLLARPRPEPPGARRAPRRLDDPLERERDAFPTTPASGMCSMGWSGYSAAPTVLQAVVWAAFLGVGLTLFLRPASRPAPGPPSSAPAARGVTSPPDFGARLAWLALSSVEC